MCEALYNYSARTYNKRRSASVLTLHDIDYFLEL